MGKSLKFLKSRTLENQNLKLAVCLQNITISKLHDQIPLDKLKLNQKKLSVSVEFSILRLWKVNLKILNSGIILKTFTHGDNPCKQFGTRSELTKCRPWPLSQPFDTLIDCVTWKIFLKDTYFVIYGIVSEFTDKGNFTSLPGQFQYLTLLRGLQGGLTCKFDQVLSTA